MIRLLKHSVRNLLTIAGRVYVPGSRLADALRIADKVTVRGMKVTLGYFPHMSDTPSNLNDISCSIIDAISERYTDAYPSVKVPAFRYDSALIAQVVKRAQQFGLLTHFDSHEIHTADATFECLREAALLGGRLGITLPGRWRRSVDDAQLVKALSVRPRIVKGEWADPTEPNRDRSRGFLEVVDSLNGYAGEVALATHDAQLVRESLKRLHASGTSCQIELLNGLPKREVLAVAREYGVGVRIYVPFGIAWRPYAMNKVRENPRILFWLLNDTMKGLLATLRP